MSTPLRERPDAPLGTLIFRAGLLPAETIESALQESSRTGKRLGEILLERNLLNESDLSRLLAGQKGLPFVSLRERGVDAEAARLFSEDQARLYRALPFGVESGSPVVAISDPTNEVVMRNIREALGGGEVQFAVATRSELAALMTEIYQPNGNGTAGHVEAQPAKPAISSQSNGAVPEAAAVAAYVTPEPAPESTAAAEPEPAPESPVHVEPVADSAPEPAPETAPAPTAEETAAEPDVRAAAPEPQRQYEGPGPVPAEVVESADRAPEPEPAPIEPAPAAEEPRREPPPLRVVPAAEAEAPVASPRTQPTPESAGESVPETATVRVVIRLSNNDRVEAAVVGDVRSAKSQAKALIRYIAGKDRSDWPYIGGRFIRPDAIVSVDLVAPDADTSVAR